MAVERPEVRQAPGTPVLGENESSCGDGAARLNVQNHSWHILNARHMLLLILPDVLHLTRVQQRDAEWFAPVLQLLQKLLDAAGAGLHSTGPAAAVKRQLSRANLPVHEVVRDVRHPFMLQMLSFHLSQQGDVERVPLEDARRQTSEKSRVEGMGVRRAPGRQTENEAPDVQPDVEIRPSSKPGLHLAHVPVLPAAARVHIQQHRRSRSRLPVPLHQAQGHGVQTGSFQSCEDADENLACLAGDGGQPMLGSFSCA